MTVLIASLAVLMISGAQYDTLPADPQVVLNAPQPVDASPTARNGPPAPAPEIPAGQQPPPRDEAHVKTPDPDAPAPGYLAACRTPEVFAGQGPTIRPDPSAGASSVDEAVELADCR